MALSEHNEVSLLLSAQRALTYNVPRGVRAIYIRADEGRAGVSTIDLRAYFDREPTPDDTEPLRVALTEMLSDFPDAKCTREEYLTHPTKGFTRAANDWLCVFALSDGDGCGERIDVV